MNLISYSLIKEMHFSGLEMILSLTWEMLTLLRFLVVLDERLVIRYVTVMAKVAHKFTNKSENIGLSQTLSVANSNDFFFFVFFREL